MKWILIAVHLSGWDGAYKGQATIGTFEKLEECHAEPEGEA